MVNIEIPSYQQWMNDTRLGTLRPRSSQLKAVDQAIQQYEDFPNLENLHKIRNAFEAWKQLKGRLWRDSDRNKGPAHPIARLDEQLSKVAYHILPSSSSASVAGSAG